MKKLFFTAKEWNRFSWSMQEILCKKYNVILTDYKTTKEKIMSVLDNINAKNFDNVMKKSNKVMSQFGKAVDSLTRPYPELGQDKNTKRDYHSKEKIWGESVDIWSKSENDNMERIWGKRNDG